MKMFKHLRSSNGEGERRTDTRKNAQSHTRTHTHFSHNRDMVAKRFVFKRLLEQKRNGKETRIERDIL